jgi:hypothetical protein
VQADGGICGIDVVLDKHHHLQDPVMGYIIMLHLISKIIFLSDCTTNSSKTLHTTRNQQLGTARQHG